MVYGKGGRTVSIDSQIQLQYLLIVPIHCLEMTDLQAMSNHLNSHIQSPVKLNQKEKKRCRSDGPKKREKDAVSFEDAVLASGVQLPSYFTFIKLLAIIMGLLCLTFTLPLCIIVSTRNITSENGSFLTNYSIFSIISTSSLDMLAYLALPAYLIQLVLLALLHFKCKDIQNNIDHTKILPNNYAIFLRLPALHLSQKEISQHIEAWFTKEIKFNSHFAQQCPQLCLNSKKEELSDLDSSLFSHAEGKEGNLQSKIIESVLLSFNYEQYLKISQEVEGMDKYLKDDHVEQLKPEEINALIQLYNKKKNIFSLLPTNEYCLVIFKNIKYAQYFYKMTSSNIFTLFLCPQKFSDFEIQHQQIKAVEGLLPNEIYWQQLHQSGCNLIKKRLKLIAFWMLFVAMGIGFQFGSIYLKWSNLINHSYQVLYYLISALIINFIVFISNKLLARVEQPYAYYSQQKKSTIIQSSFLNIICLTLSPLVISNMVSSSLLYDSNGFILYQLITIIVFMIMSIADIYISALCCRLNRATQIDSVPIQKPNQKLQSILSTILTALSMTYCIAPFFPLIIPLALVWFVGIYFLEKINITLLYGKSDYHSNKLMNSVIIYLRRSICLFLGGVTAVFGYASANFNNPWSLPAIVIIPLLFLIALIFQLIDFSIFQSLHNCCTSKKQSQLSRTLLDLNYAKIKHNFVMLYEQFNFALSYKLTQNKSHGYSTRIKIYQELNTMSKTLSLSLKERLFANVNPIINNDKVKQRQENEDVNDIYFEYERKVTMKKPNPKIAIPPLFKKEQSFEKRPQDDNQVEMVNFNSIFSSDDKEGKRMLKRQIKMKLYENAVQI